MTPLTDIKALKDEISRTWLGHKGVAAVGVRRDSSGQPIVVISLDGHDPRVVIRLQDAYRGQPVLLETDTGPIELRSS